jgi:hypothetical protein
VLKRSSTPPVERQVTSVRRQRLHDEIAVGRRRGQDELVKFMSRVTTSSRDREKTLDDALRMIECGVEGIQNLQSMAGSGLNRLP